MERWQTFKGICLCENINPLQDLPMEPAILYSEMRFWSLHNVFYVFFI